MMKINNANQGDAINLAAWNERSRVNGPGERFVIWVQGCSLSCPGCINQEFQSPRGGKLVSINVLAERILNTPFVEGVTFTGGEPFEQSAALTSLSKILKSNGMTIVSYSGLLLEQIQQRANPSDLEFLSMLDILIDGPYIAAEKDNLLWRGSRNQKVHFLTSRYENWASRINMPKQEAEFIIKDGEWMTNGFWDETLREKIASILKNAAN